MIHDRDDPIHEAGRIIWELLSALPIDDQRIPLSRHDEIFTWLQRHTPEVFRAPQLPPDETDEASR
jgi:hypothetical protein